MTLIPAQPETSFASENRLKEQTWDSDSIVETCVVMGCIKGAAHRRPVKVKIVAAASHCVSVSGSLPTGSALPG